MMADRTSRRSRWMTTVLSAPVAAAAFGLTTTWAMHTAPATQTTPPSGTGASTPAGDAPESISALQRSAAAEKALLARLERRINVLRSEVNSHAAGGSSTTAPAGSNGGSTTTAAGAPRPPAPAPAAVVPAPSPPPAPAPAPSAAPPPVQTSTGASGGAG